MMFALRSVTLAYILYSTKHLRPSSSASMLFLLTLLISVDNTKMHKHGRLLLFLESNPTPPSKSFSYKSWRAFALAKFSHLVQHHPVVARRMIEFVFKGVQMPALSQRNVASAMHAVFTSRGIYEDAMSLDFDVAEIELIIKPLGPFSSEATARDSLRPNNPKTNPMPLTPIYYPLIVSLPKFFVRQSANLFLNLQGYSRKTSKETGLVFWSRTTNINAPTVVFFHGIGMGMVPYLHFVPQFVRDVPNVILVEFPGISGHDLRRHKTPPYPTCEEIALCIRSHLKDTISPRSKCIGVSHSFGTMVLSAIMNSHPSTFAATVYLDPVNFFPGATSLGPVLYIPLSVSVFLSCVWQGDWFKFITHLAAGDIYTQHLIKNVQEFGEYASRENDLISLVVVSGNDPMVDAEGVRDTLKDSTECWMYSNHIHGDVIWRPYFHKRLKGWIDDCIEKHLSYKGTGEFAKGELRRASASCSQLKYVL